MTKRELNAILTQLAIQATQTLGREVTKDMLLKALLTSGKSGVVGFVFDGLSATSDSFNYHQQGLVSTRVAVEHVANEASAGFVTSTLGVAGTALAKLFLKKGGPAPLFIGIGAGVVGRWTYRRLFPSPLPKTEEEVMLDETDQKDLEELLAKVKIEFPEEDA